MAAFFWWCVTGVAIAGTLLNARKRHEGFYFWLVSNVALLAKNVVMREWQQAALWAVYCVLAVYGLITWKRKAQNG